MLYCLHQSKVQRSVVVPVPRELHTDYAGLRSLGDDLGLDNSLQRHPVHPDDLVSHWLWGEDLLNSDCVDVTERAKEIHDDLTIAVREVEKLLKILLTPHLII